jgi:hypothetical protein
MLIKGDTNLWMKMFFTHALSMFINVESWIKDKITFGFITKETPEPSDPIGQEQKFWVQGVCIWV